MTNQKGKDNKDLQPQVQQKSEAQELDAAGRSLSEALRISFIVLKIIMAVLVIAFLASGFKTVGPDEKALVLRFGKVRGIGEERLLGPGLHWVFPYPIDEIIRIPTEKKVDLSIDSFWYYQSPAEISRGPKERIYIPQALDPIRDGYCLTRSGPQENVAAGSDGSDYNIVHSRWQLTYQIDDPERFFKNVYIEDVKPGEIYFDVMEESIAPFLKAMFDDAVVTAMVNYTIDEALSSQDTIPDDVRKLLQEKLDKIESGIKAVSVYLTDITWPRQVNEAFLASMTASQKKDAAINEAQTYRDNTLIEAASQVQQQIAEAEAYQTEVVASARANADYLQQLLPEYRKYPKLVIQKIYKDAVQSVLNNADEKFVIQPTEGAKGKELRIQVSRDPKLKPKSKKERSP